jgi:surfactin synthase thioesterase subunit
LGQHHAAWINDQHVHELSGVRQVVSALSESEQDNLRNDIKIADVAHSETMIGMAEAVLTMAPEKFALAGLSMGGYVSLEIMRVLLASDQDSDLTSREKNRKAAPRKNLKLHCQP